MQLKTIIKGVRSEFIKHSPEILMGLGITGMASSVILAVKATPKAIKIIEDLESERIEKLKKTEVVKETWKCYIPTVGTFLLATMCLVGADSIYSKRNAALLTVYKLSESALREYKDAVIDTVGESKEKEIKEKIHNASITKNPISNSEIIITGNGEVLCFDTISSRYFTSSIENISRAENRINKIMLDCMYVSLSDLYDELGLKHTSISDILGWNLDNGLVEIHLDSHISENGKPCIVIDFEEPPTYDFDKLCR